VCCVLVDNSLNLLFQARGIQEKLGQGSGSGLIVVSEQGLILEKEATGMAAGNGNGGFFSNLPILDGKNSDHWVIRMEAILGYKNCGRLSRRVLRRRTKPQIRRKIARLDVSCINA